MLCVQRKSCPGVLDALKRPRDTASGLAQIAAEYDVLRRLMRLAEVWLPQCPTDAASPSVPVVRVHGVFLEGPHPGLLLQHFGISLLAALQPGRAQPLDEAARVRIACNVASAARYMHGHDIVHRDLKAANVLVNPADGFRAKVIDFGTSHGTALDSLTAHVVNRGTLYAMAPELLRVYDGTDAALEAALSLTDFKASDVYAYGVLLCEMWAARMPFRLMPTREGHSELANYRHSVDEQGWRPRQPKAMRDAFWALTQHCWAQAPAERYTFEEVSDAVGLLMGGAPGSPAGASDDGGAGAGGSAAFGRAPSLEEAAETAALRATERVTVTIRYAPCFCAPRVPELRVSFARAAPGAQLATQSSGTVQDGCFSVSFVFLIAPNEVCKLKFTPVAHDTAWLGASASFLTAEPKTVKLPTAWPASLPPAGVHAALRVHVSRLRSGSERTLGALSVLLMPEAAAHASAAARARWNVPRALTAGVHTDVMLSYRDKQTGVESGHNFAEKLRVGLQACGWAVFCYSTLVTAGDHHVNVLTHGIQACTAFVCLCSSEYGDVDISPWSHNELLQAEALRNRVEADGSRRGRPHIVPVWHSDAYPPCREVAAILGAAPAVPCADDFAAGRDARSLGVAATVHALTQALDKLGVVRSLRQPPPAPPS